MRKAKEGSISYEIRNLKVGYKAVFPIGKRASVNSICSNIGFSEGKIFHTEDDANQMLKKLRAVLRGAEVIEMPSEEEIRRYANSVIYQPSDCNRHIHAYEVVAYARGVEKGVEYLKSKIVK